MIATSTDYRPPVRQWCIEMLTALFLAVIATAWLEHSSIDLAISQWFYMDDGQWWIAKDARLPDWVFYTGPKRLLILLEVYLILAYVYRWYADRQPKTVVLSAQRCFSPVAILSKRELGYLAITMLMIPTVIASLKSVTHVACPAYLTLFGGDMPYLPLLESMAQKIPAKCFPAAHASSGFALYALAFLPSLTNHRWKIIASVTLFAWLMGGYKMAIGDHFFSHTLVSMLLAWAMSAFAAICGFRRYRN
ncbi:MULTISPECIES: PAP2 family lipid A phosphatase [unclassified Acinetobacter]|uniref:PAP2 family lipid A phosphatase n=1 Tax=unclassified Acinetobacter TaxID=196816 RepID=UPI0035B88B28